MSYCRFVNKKIQEGWTPEMLEAFGATKPPELSDVYVIYATGDVYQCYCAEMFCSPEAAEMVEHLLGHRGRGDKVPQFAIDALQEEAEAER